MTLETCEAHGRVRCGECREVECLREENAKLRAGLEDIRDHSHPPFEGFKWVNYINEVARETLAACDETHVPEKK